MLARLLRRILQAPVPQWPSAMHQCDFGEEVSVQQIIEYVRHAVNIWLGNGKLTEEHITYYGTQFVRLTACYSATNSFLIVPGHGHKDTEHGHDHAAPPFFRLHPAITYRSVRVHVYCQKAEEPVLAYELTENLPVIFCDYILQAKQQLTVSAD